jgi:hypothetical protein
MTLWAKELNPRRRVYVNPRRRVYVEIPKSSRVELKCSFDVILAAPERVLVFQHTCIDPTPRV